MTFIIANQHPAGPGPFTPCAALSATPCAALPATPCAALPATPCAALPATPPAAVSTENFYTPPSHFATPFTRAPAASPRGSLHRVSPGVVVLRNPQGRRYFGSKSLEKGTSGQWMLLVDDDGKQWGAKVFSLKPKGSPPATSSFLPGAARRHAEEALDREAEERLKANERIDKEIRNIAKHSLSLKVVDDFETKDDRRYVVMTAKPGNLANVLDDVSDSRKRRAAIRYAAAGVAHHLARMDAHGSMHGDVKEANVLVDRTGKVELCDFGSVHDFSPHNPDAPVVECTASTYPPPERPYGRSGDMWALGATITSMSRDNTGAPNIFSWTEFYSPDASFHQWRKTLVRRRGRLALPSPPPDSTWNERFRKPLESEPGACERLIRDLPDRQGEYRYWHSRAVDENGAVRFDQVPFSDDCGRWTSGLRRDRDLFTFTVPELVNPVAKKRIGVAYAGPALDRLMAPGEARLGKKTLASAAKKQPSVAIFATLQTYREQTLKAEKAEKARAKASAHKTRRGPLHLLSTAFNPVAWVRRGAA